MWNYLNKVLFIVIIVSIASNTVSLNFDRKIFITKMIEHRINHGVNLKKVSTINCYSSMKCSSNLVVEFYKNNNYMPVWLINNQPTQLALQLIEAINTSDQEGLDPNNYHLATINLMLNQLNKGNTSIELLTNFELTMTDIYFLYTSNLAYGRFNKKKIFPNDNIKSRNFNLSELLQEALKANNLEIVYDQINPKYIGYNKLKEELKKYLIIKQSGDFTQIPNGPKLKLHDVGWRVILLNTRLITTGELKDPPGFDYNTFGLATARAVQKFQRNHGLKDTGQVNYKTLVELNKSSQYYIDKIVINLDRMRYLSNDLGKNYIWINIPDFALNIVESNTIIRMPIIVGKEGNRSCIVDSEIFYIEINPFWNIPKDISVNDLLPKMRESSGYIKEKNIIVYKNNYGNRNIIDPDLVNWQRIESSNFNFVLRQAPGEQNALGRIKFIFANDCGIYLHDTSEPQLFKSTKRDYSHGCIRVSKPIELAKYLLNNQLKQSDLIESQILSGKRKVVTLHHPYPIHIVYFTAWVNKNNQFQLRPDIYHIDNY